MFVFVRLVVARSPLWHACVLFSLCLRVRHSAIWLKGWLVLPPYRSRLWVCLWPPTSRLLAQGAFRPHGPFVAIRGLRAFGSRGWPFAAPYMFVCVVLCFWCFFLWMRLHIIPGLAGFPVAACLPNGSQLHIIPGLAGFPVAACLPNGSQLHIIPGLAGFPVAACLPNGSQLHIIPGLAGFPVVSTRI